MYKIKVLQGSYSFGGVIHRVGEVFDCAENLEKTWGKHRFKTVATTTPVGTPDSSVPLINPEFKNGMYVFGDTDQSVDDLDEKTNVPDLEEEEEEDDPSYLDETVGADTLVEDVETDMSRIKEEQGVAYTAEIKPPVTNDFARTGLRKRRIGRPRKTSSLDLIEEKTLEPMANDKLDVSE